MQHCLPDCNLLPRQRELERYAEVVGRGGVRRGGHYGDVGLMVEVGVQGEHAREGIVGRDVEHLQLAQSAVGEAPFGEHRQHRGEEVGKTLYTSVC